MTLDSRGLKKIAMRLIIQAGQDWDWQHPETGKHIYRGGILRWIKTDEFELWCDAANMNSSIIKNKFVEGGDYGR